MTPVTTNGSGTHTDWNVALSGDRGVQGTAGAGTGDMLAANNLNDVASVATAVANLGLTIGTNVQAFSPINSPAAKLFLSTNVI
jgi:hypothetical protein